MLQNDVIKCWKMMSSNVALLHSNNCCVLEPAICEDLDLHVVNFFVFHDTTLWFILIKHRCMDDSVILILSLRTFFIRFKECRKICDIGIKLV